MQVEQTQLGDYQCWQVPLWHKANFVHGFLGADCDAAKPKDVARLKEVLSAEGVALLRQKHSTTIVECEEHAGSDGEALEGDGWIFLSHPKRRLVYAVQTADCFPLLLFSNYPPCAAALHCGWRGAVAGIVPKALGQMKAHGADPKQITAAIGAGAGVQNYEIGEELIEPFYSAVGSDLEARARVVCHKDGRLYADISALLCLQLMQEGIPEPNIARVNECTISSPLFFSYRRQGRLAGRQLSFYMST